MAADAHGNLIDFEVTVGEVHDAKAADSIIYKVGVAKNFVADKGYDSGNIRERARQAGMNPVIPRKSNSKKLNPEFDAHLYKLRHLVENLFARLKHFRGIATRFEKLARNFKAMVFIACMLIWLKLICAGLTISAHFLYQSSSLRRYIYALSSLAFFFTTSN